jgi:hypothetical protein
MEYRKAKTAGATYFFTLVTHNRRKFLCAPENIVPLRKAISAGIVIALIKATSRPLDSTSEKKP